MLNVVGGQYNSCDFEYSRPLLLQTLWGLFDRKTRLLSILPTNPWKISNTGLSGIHFYFAQVESVLQVLETTLSVLYTSIATDTLCEILKLDSKLLGTASSVRGKNSKGRGPMNGGQSMTTVPKVFSEMLGYISCRVENKGFLFAIIYYILPKHNLI